MALSLEQKMEAIYWRSQGDSFSDVLEGYEITANQFFGAVRYVEREDDGVLRSTGPEIVDDIKEVLDDEDKMAELFNMGRDFLKERYDAVQRGDEGKLPKGVYLHKENAYWLIDIVLSRIEGFKEADRAGKVDLIRKHVVNYGGGPQKYFHDNKLNGLLATSGIFKKEGSPIAVLEFWDEEYCNRSDEVSIFDLEQDTCIRFWEIRERGLWNGSNGKENAYTALNYTLNQIEGFKEADRAGKIKLIRGHVVNYNGGAQKYFKDNGLTGLLVEGQFRKSNSPIAALEFWNEEYGRREEEVSLFDLEQKECLKFWEFGENGLWNGPDGEENAYTAINYTLEQIEGFREADRTEKIALIDEHVINYGALKFFRDNGLIGLLSNGKFRKNDSPIAAIEFWDREYSKINKEVCLFDSTQDVYLAGRARGEFEDLEVRYN